MSPMNTSNHTLSKKVANEYSKLYIVQNVANEYFQQISNHTLSNMSPMNTAGLRFKKFTSSESQSEMS